MPTPSRAARSTPPPDRDRSVAEAVAGLDPRVTWGVHVLVDDVAVASRGADLVLPTASVGKVLLLLAVAEQLGTGDLDAAERLAVDPGDAVADSGLWQHLAEPTLAVGSAAALVGAVSDNLATNVLLRRVGLDAVRDVAARLGLRRTALHDRVRDHRGPEDAPTLSTGTARELAALMRSLRRGEALDAATSALVTGWLRLGADLSMTAAPLGLDPLAHVDADRGVTLAHKTGTDDGTRVDCGTLSGPAATADYCVAARWDPAREDLRSVALAGHHAVGAALGVAVGAP